MRLLLPKEKKTFSKTKYLQSFHRPFVWEFFFLWPSNKESSLFQYRFRIADPEKTKQQKSGHHKATNNVSLDDPKNFIDVLQIYPDRQVGEIDFYIKIVISFQIYIVCIKKIMISASKSVEIFLKFENNSRPKEFQFLQYNKFNFRKITSVSQLLFEFGGDPKMQPIFHFMKPAQMS